jgi:hypothetical protein
MCRILVQIGKPLKKSVYKDFLDACVDYPEGQKRDLHEHNQDKLYTHFMKKVILRPIAL